MLKIGWAYRDVSTNDPVLINGQGYLRISKGVLDPVTVTALTIENNGDYVIFLEADFTNIRAGILNLICDKVKKNIPLIDTSKIIMNATHSHTAPLIALEDTVTPYGDLTRVPHDGIEFASPSEYTKFLIDSAADAICESYKNKKEGSMSYGYGYAAVAHSRRVCYDEQFSKTEERKAELKQIGTSKMYGHTELDDFSHYEAGDDHIANFMFTFDTNDKLTGAIVNIPCPSQNCEVEWYLSSDYWHDVRTKLKEKYGDIFVLPQCAAAGDLAPRILHYYDAQDRRYRLKYSDIPKDKRLIEPVEMYNRYDIADRICTAFDEVLAWAQKEKFNNPKIIHSVKELNLERRLISDEENTLWQTRLEKMLKFSPQKTDDIDDDFKKNTSNIGYIADCENMVARYKEQQEVEKFKTEAHIIRIGDMAFATNQFELYMDYQHRIQARSPFEQTFIVQLCASPYGNAGSYLATKRGVEGKGYSAIPTSCRVSPNGGQQLVDETVAELKNLKSK